MKTFRINIQLCLTRGVIIGGSILFLNLDSASAEQDPIKILGANTCKMCHQKEFSAWQATPHFRTFSELEKRTKAKIVRRLLNIKRIKNESDCWGCHFTVQYSEGKNNVISGISCESCHGASRDWIKLHSDYGGFIVSKEEESDAHKKERLEETARLGMIRPDRLYELTQNCYQCHTVPNEKLVNIGGHKAGSQFELVAWSQGQVRHNFHGSGGRENREPSPERKRMLYVVGRALDLEYAFRGVAAATTKASYAIRMAQRARRARTELELINEVISIPEIISMLQVAERQKLKLNNEKALIRAAAEIASIAKLFVSHHDGSKLIAIDPLLPEPSEYKGKSK